MSESGLGRSVAATRHSAGTSENGLGAPAAGGPPPRAAGGGKAPAATNRALAIVTPGSDTDARRSHAAWGAAGPCAAIDVGSNSVKADAAASAAAAIKSRVMVRRILPPLGTRDDIELPSCAGCAIVSRTPAGHTLFSPVRRRPDGARAYSRLVT